jgi:hypothetical protein
MAIAAVAGLTACGGIPGSTIVVRVGNQAISEATVEDWTRVVERGGAFSGSRGTPEGTARQRAIALLISSNWLIGEAARQGVTVTPASVRQALARRQGEGRESQKRLHATGQTLAGLEFETRAELAAEAVLGKLAKRAESVPEQDVREYYEHNLASFHTPEVRITDLIEAIPSRAAAAALARRIGTARRFPRTPWHEYVTKTPNFTGTPQKAELVSAIFAARPGAISRPMMIDDTWAIFVVRNVLPPVPRRLAQVRAEILKRLRATRRRELKARYDSEYVKLWRSRTTCRSGYVAPGCPQLGGSLEAYEDPFSSRVFPAFSEQA